MTKTHYKSTDQIVEIITTTDDARYPRHSAPMAIIKLRPKDHSRCRNQWGCVTLMVTHEELRALVGAVKICDSGFDTSMKKKSHNKPESRRLWWFKNNQKRVKGK